MNALIIEDEPLTAQRIADLLAKSQPEIRVAAILDSVRTSVNWLRTQSVPDLILMDIQLSDGLSFDIFSQTEVVSPVIFITAFQEYAIRAFKVHSVDYLLKPVVEEELNKALLKFQRYFMKDSGPSILSQETLLQLRHWMSRSYKTRFMVRAGEHIRSVECNDILYFFSLQRGTFLHTADNRDYPVDFTLDALSEMLDPQLFFRINRQYIIGRKAIRDVITLSSVRVRAELKHLDGEDIHVSRHRLPDFKTWLDT
ncbi:MAG: LytTR family DNA-binding domain-containing protein [Bacteroidales bacterium]